MVYINECIDSETEFGKKYLSLVSKDDEVMATHLHHIVPVAYFKDVLGISECRKKGSPDMDPDNLVKLSVEKHLLAHYYLMKCAKKCIKAQIVNAFMCTYKTTSVDGITEDDVLARMTELDAEYAALKNGKRPHKDEITMSNGKNTHRITRWLNGEKYGPYVVYDNKGRIKELGKYGTEIKIRLFYFDEYQYNYYDKKNPYINDELVEILVDIGLGGKLKGSIMLHSNGFSIEEYIFGKGPTAHIHLFQDYNDDNRLTNFYEFKPPSRRYSGFIPHKDTERYTSLLNKTVFSDEIYKVIASIIEWIATCKEVCPHMYSKLAKDHVLKTLAVRTESKSKDITEIISTVNEYVNSKVIPCELLPSVA